MIGQRAALRFPRDEPGSRLQALQLAHLGVGALEHRFAAGGFEQAVQDRLAPALDAGGEELRHQHVGVAVHHQAGQAVRLAVHQAHRIGVPGSRQLLAQLQRPFDPARGRSRVDGSRGIEASRRARGSASSGCRRRARAAVPSCRAPRAFRRPCRHAFSTAPEKIQGWRRLSDFSRPFFSTRAFIFSSRADARRRRPWPAPGVEVGVDLRGRDAGVAEHLLHRAQVPRGLQHVARRTSGAACADARARAGRAGAPRPEARADRAGADAPAARADEQRLLAAAPRCAARSSHARSASRACAPTGTVRVLEPLPVTVTSPWRRSRRPSPTFERDQLGQAQAGGVEQLEHRAVPDRRRRRRRRRRPGAAARSRRRAPWAAAGRPSARGCRAPGWRRSRDGARASGRSRATRTASARACAATGPCACSIATKRRTCAGSRLCEFFSVQKHRAAGEARGRSCAAWPETAVAGARRASR